MSSNYPNMSYCMYENTSNALRQILDDLQDAVEEGTTLEEYKEDLSSGSELAAFKKFKNLLVQTLEEINELENNSELDEIV